MRSHQVLIERRITMPHLRGYIPLGRTDLSFAVTLADVILEFHTMLGRASIAAWRGAREYPVSAREARAAQALIASR
jgi:hypothetical protein